MALTATSQPAPRHPWLAGFESDPVKAFGDLLAGYARIPPYERADAPDAARMLFGPLPPDDPARALLARAILGWLGQRRRMAPPPGLPRLQRWVREICEAFEIVASLDVAEAAATLRRHFIIWNEWTARFTLSPARDARAEYWRMLALTQPLLRRTGATNETDGLAPLWHEICREAGGALRRHYLDIGLLGLRRLPISPAGTEVPFVAGLAQWALAQDPPAAEFQAEWRALKPLYPREPGRWRELIGRLLGSTTFRDHDITAPAWWRGDPDFAPMLRENFRLRGEILRSPGPAAAQALIDRMGGPWGQVEPRIDDLMRPHRRFADDTGDPRFFVRAVHALGSALIRPGQDEPTARASKAQSLAREGLKWQPYDRYLWSLWRDALAMGGALEAAELVGWEAIRRDPEDVDARNQLATLLAETLHRPAEAEALLRDTVAAFSENAVARTQLATLLAETLHRPAEAEALLRDTIAEFPEDAFPRNQLAELLIAGGRPAEAEAVVDAAFTDQSANEVTFAVRARLQSHKGARDEAMATLREGIMQFPSNPVLRDYERHLAGGRPLRLERAATTSQNRQPPPPLADTPRQPEADDTLRFGTLRRLRFRVDSAGPTERQAALDEVRAILRENETFAYAQVLAARYLPEQADGGALPNFAVAFEQALAQSDRTRLEQLARTQPRLEALTLVARAVLGDENAAWMVEALLKAPPARREPRAVSFLRASLAPLLAAPGDMSWPQRMAANGNTIRRHLYDANEASLGDRIAA